MLQDNHHLQVDHVADVEAFIRKCNKEMADNHLFSKTSVFIIVILFLVCLLLYSTYTNVYNTSNEQIADLQQQLAVAKAASASSNTENNGSATGSTDPTTTPSPSPTTTKPTPKNVTLNVNSTAVYTSRPNASGISDGYFIFDMGPVPTDINQITNITLSYNLDTPASVSFVMYYPTPSSLTPSTANARAQTLLMQSGNTTSGSATISPSTQGNPNIPFTSYQVIQSLQGYHIYLSAYYSNGKSLGASGSMTITYI